MSANNLADPEFYIIDFDRTLVDSDKLFEAFVQLADKYYKISRDQLDKAHLDFIKRGDSFDTASYVRNHLIDEDRLYEWDGLEKRYIHEARSMNMLLPGAAELLEWLAAKGKRYGMLTYGNPMWQRMKLSASGFNHMNHIVMVHKEKSKLINSWHKPDGSFRIPDELGRGEASSIVLIDDKAISFNGFPESPSMGYWVCDPMSEMPSQHGVVPDNVTRFNNLLDVVRALQSY